jgi:superfamily II DNA or RNA helicase
MLPGDYVVHEKYGIGRYVGIRQVDLTPARPKATLQPVIVIQYKDTEVTFFVRTMRDELWMYRSGESGTQELSTVLDTRKWRRRRTNAETDARSTGINLVRMMAIRNGYHRTPCLDSSRLDQYKKFEDSFKFEPTADQVTCFRAIESDMTNNTRPMDRLVCGDVGFGKTEVAMRAMYRAVLSNRQVAVLAPTRVLAMQHLRVIQARMPDVNTRLLRGGGLGTDTKMALANGTCQVVVGTHAILQDSVKFDNLGLLIIDEEQRFGVDQKEKLKAATRGVDVLTLSATPIPRTLQLSLSGLRDFSLVMTPPKGRKEVQVKVTKFDRDTIKAAVEKEIARGGQVFIVVPFVANVSTTHDMMRELLPKVVCVEAHGRHANLEDRIDFFSSKQAQVLIATTVVENGVDMPNVNTILVMDADRFGMSTLYQLRGRVGRSPRQAFAYFMTQKGKILTRESEARLMFLATFTALGSGYDLAKRDMEMRGAGQVFGASQSGSRDVGMDFQSKILELAIEEIKLDLVMPCVETRITLGNRMESDWGADLIGAAMPGQDDLNGVSRWEATVAERIINTCMGPARAAESREMLRNFLAANSQGDLSALLKHWRLQVFDKSMGNGSGNGDGVEGLSVTASSESVKVDDSSVPIVLQELIKRSLLRVICRRLGIDSVERIGADVLLRSESISKKIWATKLAESVPEDLSDQVIFVHPPDEVPNSRDTTEPVCAAAAAPTRAKGGNIVLINCFDDRYAPATDMLSMPVSLLRLVTPLANVADLKLIEEVEANTKKGLVKKEKD